MKWFLTGIVLLISCGQRKEYKADDVSRWLGVQIDTLGVMICPTCKRPIQSQYDEAVVFCVTEKVIWLVPPQFLESEKYAHQKLAPTHTVVITSRNEAELQIGINR